MNKLIILLILSQWSWCQSNALLIRADSAFAIRDFKLAKELYSKAIVIDSLNKNAIYNLGASEYNLGEKDSACEHFYKVHLIGDKDILKTMKEFCPYFRNGTIMSMDNIDEKPKYIYKGKEYPLFENNLLNPDYLKFITRELKSSRILKNEVKGKLFVVFSINKTGIFEAKILNKGTELVKMEVLRIFRSLTYIPAKHNGKTVQLLEKWLLPLNFAY